MPNAEQRLAEVQDRVTRLWEAERENVPHYGPNSFEDPLRRQFQRNLFYNQLYRRSQLRSVSDWETELERLGLEEQKRRAQIAQYQRKWEERAELDAQLKADVLAFLAGLPRLPLTLYTMAHQAVIQLWTNRSSVPHAPAERPQRAPVAWTDPLGFFRWLCPRQSREWVDDVRSNLRLDALEMKEKGHSSVLIVGVIWFHSLCTMSRMTWDGVIRVGRRVTLLGNVIEAWQRRRGAG